MVGPQLHHLPALLQVFGAVVGAAQAVLDGVGELRLDDLGGDVQLLGKQRARGRPKAVPDDLVRSMTDYSRDPAKLAAWRDRMADLIEQAGPKAANPWKEDGK